MSETRYNSYLAAFLDSGIMAPAKEVSIRIRLYGQYEAGATRHMLLLARTAELTHVRPDDDKGEPCHPCSIGTGRPDRAERGASQ
jgi:hypothetical protein